MSQSNEFEMVAQLLLEHRWIFAKTMPQNPHEYTLRREWDDDVFVEVVQHIRSSGYKAWYKGRNYMQLDVDGRFYWSMGAPIDKTILINRKMKVSMAAYDDIALTYESLFTDDDSIVENHNVVDMLGDLRDLSVLDIGCGTGLLLDYVRPASYVGIDPSAPMLEHLKQKHPGFVTSVVCTPLRSFSGGEFDRVVALFGTGSYLDGIELERIPTLLAPGGKYFVMFYCPGYIPETYKRTGVYLSPSYGALTLPGTLTTFNNYIIVEGSRA